MDWLSRLFKAIPNDEMEGIRLSTRGTHWELEGPNTFEELFNALKGWIPEDALLYFEGGSPDAEINRFFAIHSVPETLHVAMGTIWPRPKIFHVPATRIVLTELSGIMKHHAGPELAVHFHVYRNDAVLLEWHDAFFQPMLMSGAIPEEKVQNFANKIGKKFRKIIGKGPPADADKPCP
ncbi:hypothetical protein PJI16_11890 [Nitrospira sp. MA-1]|nr:hypothetical protein [Nitrospira sp. MA-1]